jgi:uncharacterized Zn finger protein
MPFSSRRSRSARSNSRKSYYGGFAPYVPVAERRAQAAKAAAKASKDGKGWSPVVITGRKIATTFWGAAWCQHLESYSDYENRLPRGRTYVRNGSVVDLQIAPGVITARVQGSSLYTEKITISPLAPARWKAIKAACAGKVTSLVGLLQGKLPEEVLRVVTDRATGLFPAPGEIVLSCSCPDSASLCKHLAAVLYGVGARLDERPELLFLLRGVDHQELVAEALDAASRGASGAHGAAGDAGEGLSDGDLADVFGIEIGGAVEPEVVVAVEPEVKPKRVTEVKAVPVTKPKRVVEVAAVKRPPGRPRKVTASLTGAKISKATSMSEDLADAMASLGKMKAKPVKKKKAAK